MSEECVVCHQDWTAEEIEPDGVCTYCWSAYGEDWVGDDQ